MITRHQLLAYASASTAVLALPRAARAAAPRRIRMGIIPSLVASSAFYASDLGFFKKYDLDVDLQSFSSGATIAAAIIGGSLDVGFADVISISSAHLRGFSFTYVVPGFVNSRNFPGYALVSNANSSFTTGKDFNGKTIAINAVKSISQLVVQSWIDGNGGDSSTVKFVELPLPQMVSAVQAKVVDAVLPGDPFITIASESGMHVLPLDKNGLENYMGAGYFATRSWIATNGASVKRFAAAMREGALIANKRPLPPEAAPILAKYTHVPPAVISRLVMRSEYALALDPAVVQPVIDAAVKYTILAKKFPASEILAHA
jgi:NitT/TauT family transport system substrate-binding protein